MLTIITFQAESKVQDLQNRLDSDHGAKTEITIALQTAQSRNTVLEKAVSCHSFHPGTTIFWWFNMAGKRKVTHPPPLPEEGVTFLKSYRNTWWKIVINSTFKHGFRKYCEFNCYKTIFVLCIVYFRWQKIAKSYVLKTRRAQKSRKVTTILPR